MLLAVVIHINRFQHNLETLFTVIIVDSLLCHGSLFINAVETVLKRLNEYLAGLCPGSQRLLDECDGHSQRVHCTLIVTCNNND